MFLERIVTQTRSDLGKSERSLAEVQRLAAEQPAPRDILAALRDSADRTVRLIAEVKRASPSKGLLAPHLDPVALARTYEANGAAAISVLTEPHFFLGSPAYLTAIKQAVNIPILCKDFIIDEYQVYEARSWGADAILLICALLDDRQLHHLLGIARSLRMHCLVEVHSVEEAQRAVKAGASIIGVNSRDLVTFEMHPYLIRELRRLLPADRVVVAESGIHSAADARRLARYDVQAMLVGEALVVSQDVPGQMRTLLAGANESTQIKICGLKTTEHIDVAIDAGADMLGFVFYPPSHRYLTPEQASALVQDNARLADKNGKPDLVGVFVNEEAEVINSIAAQVGLHFVQLHGNESPAFCQQIQRPVIKAIPLRSLDDREVIDAYRDVAWRILLDTPSAGWGGSGIAHDWSAAQSIAQELPILLAGGLTLENVAGAIAQVRPWGVDVSSGVETERQKDPHKIQKFITNVRNINP